MNEHGRGPLIRDALSNFSGNFVKLPSLPLVFKYSSYQVRPFKEVARSGWSMVPWHFQERWDHSSYYNMDILTYLF
jgi:hypothetical protein